EGRENAVWDLAKNSSGLTAYEAYLKDFPSGRYANEARAVIGAIKQREEQARLRAVEDAAWEKAKGNGALQSYQEYLTAYPQGRYIESASAAIGAIRLAEAEKRRIEEEDAAWERAKSGARKQSYSDYIGAYPQGRFIAQARRSIAEFERLEEEKRRIDREDAAWRQAKDANTLAGYQAYLKDYPAGRFAAEARNGVAEIERAAEAERHIAREDAAWTQAQQGGDIAAYQAYLSAYPQGRYVSAANEGLAEINRREQLKREDDTWARARQNANIATYQAYLAEYPQGRYVSAANDAINVIKRAEETRQLEAAEAAAWRQAQQSASLAGYQAYLRDHPNGKYAEEARKGIPEFERIEEEN